MAVMRSYQCPDCGGVFDHLHMRSDEPAPEYCALCGADMVGTLPEVSSPRIAKSIGKTADAVYRQLEDGSAARAEAAAEYLGESPAEMSALKITDIKDNTREGETSNVVAANPVSQFMGNTGVGGMQSAQAASGFLADARRGPHAGAGSTACQGIVRNHAATAQKVAAQGNVGRYS